MQLPSPIRRLFSYFKENPHWSKQEPSRKISIFIIHFIGFAVNLIRFFYTVLTMIALKFFSSLYRNFPNPVPIFPIITKSPGKWGFLQKNVCKKLENGEQKGVPYTRNAFVLTRNSIHVFHHLSNTFLRRFFFFCVHILFTIHSKNFHSVIMPNSFFSSILSDISEVVQLTSLIHTLFSQYFILILFEYTFFIIARQPSVWHPPFLRAFLCQG